MLNQAEAQAALAALFESAAAITREQVITLGGGEGQAPMVWTVPDALLSRIPAERVDGVTVLPNDELMRVRVASLPNEAMLKPGDSLTDTDDGLQRHVITAHLDTAGILWLCAVRRVY